MLDHPILKGITLDGNNEVAVMEGDDTSVTTHTDPGNGTLIAERADNGGVWIVEWEAGQEFYSGSGEIAGGPRLWYAAGGQGDNLDGLYNGI